MADHDAKYFEALTARYHAETSDPPADLNVLESYDYIRYKAFLFLTVGPDEYRKFDAFGLPPAEWPELTLDAVRLGCRQLLDWQGLTPDRPLDGIGIGGFYSLMRLFHFGLVNQASLMAEGDPGHICDRMEMRHVVEGSLITLFNRVPIPGSGPEVPATPCPYCGAPLRTARAKQCRACGTNWHDETNATRRDSGAS